MQKIILRKPHISEKASLLAESGFYVFKVGEDANKMEVKKEVEGVYKVDVLSVRMVRLPSKKRRVGRIEGVRPGYKKAVVKIKPGQRIDITSLK